MVFRVAFFVYVFGAQYFNDGGQEDAQVAGEGLSFDVLDVEFELVFDGEAASAADLSEACESRFDAEAFLLSFVPFAGLFHVEGSWAYQGHISF